MVSLPQIHTVTLAEVKQEKLRNYSNSLPDISKIPKKTQAPLGLQTKSSV